MRFAEPWEIIANEQYRLGIEVELASELDGREAHLLASAYLLARRIDRDDFLFKTSNAQWPYAIAHLTFSGRAETVPWPVIQYYADENALATRLAQDIADY